MAFHRIPIGHTVVSEENSDSATIAVRFAPGGVTEIVCIIHITSVLCENPESKCEIARNYIGFSSLFQIFDNVTPTWKTDQPK